ncbi:hypothetical protein QTI51_32540 [Variovorax sp. J22G73]|uniref:hypothetical protein n=1 Tax=unclassified Variovorax TaxID=663243 RepID=UPI002577FA19|nr:MULTISPECIES: hypothetical protein [unclassified Variovorax]MDM0009534.1 hypothetical protein [Variovorax sp. J22R203]MDM0102042.1 hypothetical protein [Variovorax sp. J22G73]
MGEAHNVIQWVAFALSLLADWLVASINERRRNTGFGMFLLSNVVWTVWGVQTLAYALIALPVCLAALNIRRLPKVKQDGLYAAVCQTGRGC